MNIIKNLNTIKDKEFKVGDLVRIIEVETREIAHKEYCNSQGIVEGTIMRVSRVEDKSDALQYCDNDDRVCCDKICKDKCITVCKLDDKFEMTHSCYSKFVKVR